MTPRRSASSSPRSSPTERQSVSTPPFDYPAFPARLGDADRDRLAAALGEHHAAGRLDLQELDRRLGLVLGASTAEVAAAALSDLPPLRPAPPARGRSLRRHGERGGPEPGWIPTLERFRDPSSGRLMRVWHDPVDGLRHYVAEQDPRAG